MASIIESASLELSSGTTCPWVWLDNGSNQLVYCPMNSSNDQWNFTLTLTTYKDKTYDFYNLELDKLTVAGQVDATSFVTNVNKPALYRTDISFSIPWQLGITMTYFQDYQGAIPLVFKYIVNKPSSTTYTGEFTMTLKLGMDGDSRKLAFDIYGAKDDSGGLFPVRSFKVPSKSYQDDVAFATFPPRQLKDFKFKYANTSEVVFSFNSISPINATYVGPKYSLPIILSVLDGSYSSWTYIKEVVGNEVIGCASISAATTPSSKVARIKTATSSERIFNVWGVDTTYNFNMTSEGKDQILEYKTGQLEAVEFIETDDNNILLQKGGRVWAKDFIETGVRTKTDIRRAFIGEDLSSVKSGISFTNRITESMLTGTATSDINTIIASSAHIQKYDIPDSAKIIVTMRCDDDFFTSGGSFIYRQMNPSGNTKTVTSKNQLTQEFTQDLDYDSYVVISIVIPSGTTLNNVSIYYPEIIYDNGIEQAISYNKNYSITCNELTEV